MARIFICLASILAGLSVAAGAFGAHSLKTQVSETALEIFKTGAQYQMYHALSLLLVGLFLHQTDTPQPLMVGAGWAWVSGIVIFSGSLYALSLTGIKWLGAITPLGGVALIIGWGCLAIAATKL
ncbi:MAG: DUF423 domain-containing protein [Microcoleaceae cyanobacterium]